MAKAKEGKKAEAPKRTVDVTARRRGIQQPRQRGYRFRDHGRPASRVSDDNLTIRSDGPQVEVVRPTFEKGKTVFRPFPMLCAEDPSKCDPPRYSANELDFTDWIRDYPVATYVGTHAQKTFILYDPKDNTYERSSNPYVIFATNIIQGVKKAEIKHSRWNPFVPQLSAKPAIKWPTTMYMMQGLCFQSGEKIYVNDGPPRGAGDEDKPLILQATKSVGDALIKKLEILNPKFNGPEDDYEHMFLHGDPVSFEHGRMLTIFNPDKTSADSAASGSGPRKADWNAGGKRKGEGGDKAVGKGYEVKITRKVTFGNNVYEADLSDKADFFRNRIVWWDDVIRIPTHDELCVFIAQAFADHPAMMEYAWSDYPEFFTSDVKKILKARVSGPGADIPTEEDEEEVAEGSARRRKRAASLPKDVDDEEDELEDEGLDEDEDVEETEDEDVEETDDEDAEEADVDDSDDDDDDDAEDADDDEEETDDAEDADDDSDDDDDDDDAEDDDVEGEDEDVEGADDDDEEAEETDEDAEEADDEEDDGSDDEDADDDDDDEGEETGDEDDLDAAEAAMEEATRAAENRSSRRDAASGKKPDTKTGKASANKEADNKPGKKDAGKAPATKSPAAPPKENGMASKKTAKPAAKATKPTAKKPGKSKK